MEELIKTCAAFWGAVLSTWLAYLKYREGRPRLETTYSLTGNPQEGHEVTIVNVSPAPIQVAQWSIKWAPPWYAPWRGSVDVTPEETWRFRIDGQKEHTLEFSGESKFQWDYRVATGRILVPTLHVFGRRRAVRLVIGGGK